MVQSLTTLLEFSNFGHNLACRHNSVTKEFLVTIVITMPVATDIGTTFQLRDKIATITIRDNGPLKVLMLACIFVVTYCRKKLLGIPPSSVKPKGF